MFVFFFFLLSETICENLIFSFRPLCCAMRKNNKNQYEWWIMEFAAAEVRCLFNLVQTSSKKHISSIFLTQSIHCKWKTIPKWNYSVFLACDRITKSQSPCHRFTSFVFFFGCSFFLNSSFLFHVPWERMSKMTWM